MILPPTHGQCFKIGGDSEFLLLRGSVDSVSADLTNMSVVCRLINSPGVRTLKKIEKTQVLVFRFQNGWDLDFFPMRQILPPTRRYCFKIGVDLKFLFLRGSSGSLLADALVVCGWCVGRRVGGIGFFTLTVTSVMTTWQNRERLRSNCSFA